MRVREAVATDLAAVKSIYDEEVRTGTATFDVVEPSTAHWAAKLGSARRGDHFLVAVEAARVVGFAHSSTYRPRPAYDRTRETSVYLGADARGRGLGRSLYAGLLDRLRADDVHVALAVIALPNDSSIALHHALGFERVGLLPEVGLKFGSWIDTALYTLRLETGLCHSAPVTWG